MADICSRLDYEDTELRLGLSTKASINSNGKRGYETDNEDEVDLKLNLSNANEVISNKINNVDNMIKDKEETKEKIYLTSYNDDGSTKPPSKTQVVGWPPVRSFRKNILAVQKNSMTESEKIDGGNAAAFVKVSVDGAPYLRKVDLKMYKSYPDLSSALANMLSTFTIGKCGSQGMKYFMNDSKLMDVLSGSEYVTTYEDKDGDWMLVGDVPWQMFVHSCKRLRIMKGKEAIGLAPIAMEKCKNRN